MQIKLNNTTTIQTLSFVRQHIDATAMPLYLVHLKPANGKYMNCKTIATCRQHLKTFRCRPERLRVSLTPERSYFRFLRSWFRPVRSCLRFCKSSNLVTPFEELLSHWHQMQEHFKQQLALMALLGRPYSLCFRSSPPNWQAACPPFENRATAILLFCL